MLKFLLLQCVQRLLTDVSLVSYLHDISTKSLRSAGHWFARQELYMLYHLISLANSASEAATSDLAVSLDSGLLFSHFYHIRALGPWRGLASLLWWSFTCFCCRIFSGGWYCECVVSFIAKIAFFCRQFLNTAFSIKTHWCKCFTRLLLFLFFL